MLAKPNQRIAFIIPNRIGDAIIAMVLTHNLIKSGYNVTVFSDFLCSMRSWFSNATILPYSEDWQDLAAG